MPSSKISFISGYPPRGPSGSGDRHPEKLVAYLDVTIGEPTRLLRSTAHAADLLEAKGRLAGELLSNYRQDVAQDLSLLLDDPPSMPTLVIEAAYGCRETGDMASDVYKQRLRRHIAALLEAKLS